jgi:hypothetical protein
VLVTGYPEELGPTVEGAQAEGVDAVCLKPLDVPHYLAALEQISG